MNNSPPPKQYNPNLVPIGHGFGFIVFIKETGRTADQGNPPGFFM